MFEQLQDAIPDAMVQRVQAAQRELRDNGVTYNVYADAQGATGRGSSTCCR